MANQPNFDPVAEWQKFITQWEHQINDFSAKISASEEFSEAMNQASKVSLMAQRQFNDYMEKFLKTMQMPSLSKISEIHERLDRIEESIDRLSLNMTTPALSEQTAVPVSPPRTKKPVKEA